MSFTKGNGMIIQIDPNFKKKGYCCDVSWISKFPDECEILFARSMYLEVLKSFKCIVLNDSYGIQTISLKSIYAW